MYTRTRASVLLPHKSLATTLSMKSHTSTHCAPILGFILIQFEWGNTENQQLSKDRRLIGGFHVTQVSLIIRQVKNEIAYHSIN